MPPPPTAGTPYSLEQSAAKVSIALRHLAEGEPIGTGSWRIDIDLILDFVRAAFKVSNGKDIDLDSLGPTWSPNGVANKLHAMAVEWARCGRDDLPPGVARAALISVARLMRDWHIAQPVARREPEISSDWARSIRDAPKIMNLVLVKGCEVMENPDYCAPHAALIDRWDYATAEFDRSSAPLVSDPDLILESKNQVARQLLTLVHRWSLDGRWDQESSLRLLLMIEYLWVSWGLDQPPVPEPTPELRNCAIPTILEELGIDDGTDDGRPRKKGKKK